MRRGRYGNRISFRVSTELREDQTIEELKKFIKAVLLHSGVEVSIRWPADHGERNETVN